MIGIFILASCLTMNLNLEKKLLEEDKSRSIKVAKQESVIELFEERYKTELLKAENVSLKE